MGFYRFIYNILGIEYIGTKEQKEIDRQKHLKYIVCEQIKKTDKKKLFIFRMLTNKKKKKGGRYKK